MTKASTKYAGILFFLALKKQELETYLFQLQEIKKITSNTHLQEAFASPLVPLQAKKNVLELLFKDKVKEEILLFLKILTEQKKISLITEVIEEFSIKMKKQMGILSIKLISAEKIDEENKLLLQNKLEAKYNKKIEFYEEQSSKIIGGMILLFPNGKILDKSLKTCLEHLRKHLKKGKRHAA
ncbi:ATP synthase subunit delta [Waddlia chondrophila 2032/99]|uniref:ATP synthase subunit delta n=2 Tax=Waddlia chondrophila TaxID=71667 RepID=D6YWH1_WADCW|nr:ATP synthase F1 subunit delta [Waddlia chondrophila]ADI38482.1 putative F-type ATP synthase, subunit delta [Waddlia chondrophila WSU 86-1044]CCB91564.1 ATP synthase subunit delta [Waddlia chondrophila 2032/99]